MERTTPETPARAVEERAPMLDEAHQKDIVNRLNRIEGQIRGIRRMVQEPLRRTSGLARRPASAKASAVRRRFSEGGSSKSGGGSLSLGALTRHNLPSFHMQCRQGS
ncbi:MAG: metal-sensing transcriptional repressor [Acidobacteria bacterium]|nr:metal-sensing transcriptional repressor [Acidobacteriota bacterium]